MKRDWFRSFCVREKEDGSSDDEEDDIVQEGEGHGDVEAVKEANTGSGNDKSDGSDNFEENPKPEKVTERKSTSDSATATGEEKDSVTTKSVGFAASDEVLPPKSRVTLANDELIQKSRMTSIQPKKQQRKTTTRKTTMLSDPSIGFGLGVSHNSDDEEDDDEEEDGVEVPSASAEEDDEEQVKIGLNKATIYTLIAGGASGFLGGMVAIRGPPLIFYFLHPPHPVTFNKNSSRATGVVIMFFNVLMREIFYLVNTFTDDLNNKIGYQKEDWRLYLSVVICSIAGGLVGSKMFEYLKDSRDTIRGILSIFLFMCGVSLLFSAFNK